MGANASHRLKAWCAWCGDELRGLFYVLRVLDSCARVCGDAG
jgi:hypothetical protein